MKRFDLYETKSRALLLDGVKSKLAILNKVWIYMNIVCFQYYIFCMYNLTNLFIYYTYIYGAPQTKMWRMSEFLNLSKLQLKIQSSYNTHSNQTISIFNCVITN